MTLGRGIAADVVRKLPLKEAKGELNYVCVCVGGSWDRRDCHSAGTLNVDSVGACRPRLGHTMGTQVCERDH